MLPGGRPASARARRARIEIAITAPRRTPRVASRMISPSTLIFPVSMSLRTAFQLAPGKSARTVRSRGPSAAAVWVPSRKRTSAFGGNLFAPARDEVDLQDVAEEPEVRAVIGFVLAGVAADVEVAAVV